MVRDTIVGGPKVLICLPLAASEKADLLKQATDATALKPDLLEWRIDAYAGVHSLAESLATLNALRTIIGTTPLIFTCRIDKEGGLGKLTSTHRLDLITTAIHSGHADIIDVELCNDPVFITAVKEACAASDIRLILSYHNFDQTPDEAFLYGKLLQAQTMGADIAKLAVMPAGYGDVLTLINATHRARTQGLRIPMATMAMETTGGITRIAGGLFGSDITFAMGGQASAPGQIPIDRLRTAMNVIYGPA